MRRIFITIFLAGAVVFVPLAIGVGVGIVMTDPALAIRWFSVAAASAVIALFLWDELVKLKRWQRWTITIIGAVAVLISVWRANSWVANKTEENSTREIARAVEPDKLLERLRAISQKPKPEQQQVAEQGGIQFTGFIFKPLKAEAKVVVDVHMVNKSSRTVRVAGAYGFHCCAASEQDIQQRKIQEEKIWNDLRSGPIKGKIVSMSVPPNMDLSIEAESNELLPEEILKGLQGGGSLYVMGWGRSSDNRPLNFCVSARYSDGIDRPPKLLLCVRHN